VDPLDGTLSYVNGELDAVTTLIGLSVGTHPVLGIIGQPYPGEVSKDGVSKFDPKVYFGYE
jgi:3'-phosphoadenosine 5'-phosphosulfate (PAPS) 3'-phosphatase